jgi:hypothetical protein
MSGLRSVGAKLTTIGFFFLVLGSLSSQARAAPVEAIVQLQSETGAVLPYLLGWDDGHQPAAVAVLFTGGAGVVGLLKNGIPRPGANFLVRSRRLFLAQGIATAVVDAPSDLGLLTDTIRMSARHARDVAAVVTDVKQRFPESRVYLVGTSRGTVSAAYAGAALGTTVAGVVLSSTIFTASKGGSGLSRFDYASIKSPLLVVHHVDDTCVVTPYGPAKELGQTYPLISVSGGDAARSDPCEAFSAHGYLGVEAPTVAAIGRWMRGLDYPKSIP